MCLACEEVQYRGMNRTCRRAEKGDLIQAERMWEGSLVEVIPDLHPEGKQGIVQGKEGGEAGAGVQGRWAGSKLPHFMNQGWDICCRYRCPGLQHGWHISARRWRDTASRRRSRCGKCTGLIKHSAASKRNKCPQSNIGSSWQEMAPTQARPPGIRGTVQPRGLEELAECSSLGPAHSRRGQEKGGREEKLVLVSLTDNKASNQ